MAAATRIDSTLGTNFTQATLVSALKTAFANAGFNAPIDDYASGTDRILVYSFVTDSTKTYGTSYYRLRIATTFVINQAIYSTWNVTNHTGTNGSSETSYTALSTSNTVNFTSLNGGSEFKFVFVTQSNNVIPLGVIAPTTRPNWWNLNNWNYAFIWSAVTLATLTSTNLNPYSSTAYSLIINNSLLLYANTQTGNADVLAGLIIVSNTGRGIAGKTSDNLASGCVYNLTRYSAIASDIASEVFLIINFISGGLVVKVAV